MNEPKDFANKAAVTHLGIRRNDFGTPTVQVCPRVFHVHPHQNGSRYDASIWFSDDCEIIGRAERM
jgi:hypothetical protein